MNYVAAFSPPKSSGCLWPFMDVNGHASPGSPPVRAAAAGHFRRQFSCTLAWSPTHRHTIVRAPAPNRLSCRAGQSGTGLIAQVTSAKSVCTKSTTCVVSAVHLVKSNRQKRAAPARAQGFPKALPMTRTCNSNRHNPRMEQTSAPLQRESRGNLQMHSSRAAPVLIIGGLLPLAHPPSWRPSIGTWIPSWSVTRARGRLNRILRGSHRCWRWIASPRRRRPIPLSKIQFHRLRL